MGVTSGLIVAPARQANVFDQFDEAAPGVPAQQAVETKIAILQQMSRDELGSPSPLVIPARVNWSGILELSGFVVSLPALLLAIGRAFAGFSGAVRRGL